MASLKKVQGKVERVNSTALPEPESFTYQGKTITSTHRHGIKLEGIETWFNLGSSDKADLVFQDDDDKWQILGAGSEVLIKYEENVGKNGKTYYNTKKSQVTVIDMVPGERQQPKATAASAPAPRTGNAGSTAPVDWARKDAGAAASASVDKALAYIALRSGDMKTDYATVLSVARDMQAMVQQLASEILNPPETAPSIKPSPEKPKAVNKPKATAPIADNEDWNDDIPF